MSNLDSFLTGFLADTDDRLGRRQAEADDYYTKQLERARTKGVEALSARRQASQQSLTTARTLMQNANMPEKVVRALANEGLGALDSAKKIWEESTANGVNVDSSFWEETYKWSKDFNTEGEPLPAYLDRVAGLYSQNLKAAPEEAPTTFRDRLADAFTGRAYMKNSMDRLSETDIGGMSAQTALDALTAEENARPLGDIGFNENVLPLAQRNGKKVRDPFTPEQQISITEGFKKSVDDELAARVEQYRTQKNVVVTPEEEQRLKEEWRNEISREKAQEYRNSLAEPDNIFFTPYISNFLPSDEETADTEGAITVETVDAGDAANTDTFEYPKKFKGKDGRTYTLEETSGEGAVYRSDAGERTRPVPRDFFQPKSVAATGGPSEASIAEGASSSQGEASGAVEAPQTLLDAASKQPTFPRIGQMVKGLWNMITGGPQPPTQDITFRRGETPPMEIPLGDNKLTFKGTDEAAQAHIYQDETGAEILIPITN